MCESSACILGGCSGPTLTQRANVWRSACCSCTLSFCLCLDGSPGPGPIVGEPAVIQRLRWTGRPAFAGRLDFKRKNTHRAPVRSAVVRADPRHPGRFTDAFYPELRRPASKRRCCQSLDYCRPCSSGHISASFNGGSMRRSCSFHDLRSCMCGIARLCSLFTPSLRLLQPLRPRVQWNIWRSSDLRTLESGFSASPWGRFRTAPVPPTPTSKRPSPRLLSLANPNNPTRHSPGLPS